MRQKAKVEPLSSRDIQETINIRDERWVGQPLAFDVAGEALIDVKTRWLRDGFDAHVELARRLAATSKFSRPTFDHLVQAIYSPTLYDIDFLALTMMPHIKLRPVWKLLFGFTDEDFELDHYAVRALQRFIPRDVVAFWLQTRSNGGRWRRTNRSLYRPVIEDYALYEEQNERQTAFVVNGQTVVLSTWEYLDRWFLGTGGLSANWKRLAMKKSFVVQCTGKLLEGNDLAPLLSPPFTLDSEAYLSQLVAGHILPFHYPKILGDWLHGLTTVNQLGLYSHSVSDST